jgi:hypothetical protein
LRKQLDKKRNSLKIKSSQEMLGNENSMVERDNSNDPGIVDMKTPSLNVDKNIQRRLYMLM